MHSFSRPRVLAHRFYRLYHEARGAGEDQQQDHGGNKSRKHPALWLVQQHKNGLPPIFPSCVEVTPAVLAALQLAQGISLRRPRLC